MNILFAPSNIASMPGITAQAMVELGHKAKCITLSNSKYHTGNSHVICLRNSSIRNPILYIFYKSIYFFTLFRLLRWCDVVHFTWYAVLPFSIDLWLIKFMGKPRFVEWVGSDIRVPEVTMKDSPWFKNAFFNGYEYCSLESKKRSYKNQKNFHITGFVPILVPEMKLYLKPGLFDKVYSTDYRIPTREFTPNFPKIQNQKIVIVHSPSAKIAKGSNIIIPVVESLQKDYNIEFLLLHDVPRQEVLNAMIKADIFIDQIIIGSFASAALEAMSFGKPVLAFISPSVYDMGLDKNCPVINVNPDTLEQKLRELIENPQLRHDVGRNSRIYVEKVNDSVIVSKKLLEIYKYYINPVT
ncbi:MAG: glycosyltransferase [Chitinophagia bacterium]|jgi:glycosyltransferase involved in cell wall biosynthesis